ncbi:MAG: T9SS type A sorting domain-containing protein, partial [Chitinophagales bacterium]
LDVNAKADLIAYPNPTNGLVNIANGTAMDITVFDVTGNQVLKTEKNTTQIDLSDLSNGVYFLRFNNQQEAYTKKFVLLK